MRQNISAVWNGPSVSALARFSLAWVAWSLAQRQQGGWAIVTKVVAAFYLLVELRILARSVKNSLQKRRAEQA